MPASNKRLESSIQRSIIEKFEQAGILVRKKHGNGYGKAGDPDLYGSMNGQSWVIEVKQPGERPTKLQFERLQEWANSGALAGWATSVGTALCVLVDGHAEAFGLDLLEGEEWGRVYAKK